MKLEFSPQTFKKFYIKFHENTSTGRRVVLCGQTDGKTDSQKDKNDTLRMDGTII